MDRDTGEGFPCYPQQAQGIPAHGVQGTSWPCSCPLLLEKTSCRRNLLLFPPAFLFQLLPVASA